MKHKKRTRLSPEARREQLLDCTQKIIQERGLSSFTMEALAQEAEVSNPLVYKYFETRLILLQELLSREYTRFNAEVRRNVTQAQNFEEIVRIFATLNFEESSEGNIIYMLLAQPDIRECIQGSEKRDTRWVGKHLIKALSDEYHISPAQAESLVVMGSGASQAAAIHYGRHGGNKAKMIDDTVSFIFQGIDHFRRE